MTHDLKNKVVLITGGSSGIGKATAIHFAEHGANVSFSFKDNQVGAEETLKILQEHGVKAQTIKADLTKDQQAQNLVQTTINEFGHIDILINNAGRYIEGDEWNGNADTWAKSIQQNLISVMSVSKYTVEHMQSRNQGVIVNVASRHGFNGQHDALTYASAKAGIINITQAYAKIMSPWGRANSVAPGAVRAGYWVTAPHNELQENIDGTLLKQFVEPKDIAQTIIFLSSQQSRMITGQNIVIDAGFMINK